MINLDATFYVQLANFIISLIVLNFLLIRPIREIIKKRAGTMSNLISDAEKFASAADSKIKNYEAALAEARKAGTEKRLALKDAANQEERSIVDAATKAAQESLQAARKDIASQVKAARDSLVAQVGTLANQAVSKVLG